MRGKSNPTINYFTDIALPEGGNYKCKAPVNHPFAVPHSSAYLDLDGDCASDLFIVSFDEKKRKINYEIWIYVPEEGNKFCLIQTH